MPIKFKPYLQNKFPSRGEKPKTNTIKEGKKLYNLSTNENLFGASPKALTAIEKCIGSISAYPDRTDDRFRNALAKFYSDELQADQFITTNSGVANIELLVRGFMGEGTECIYSNPAFSPYYEFPKKVGGKAIDIPLIGESLGLDVEGILNAINEKTRLIFITSPNNPTGGYIPRADVDKLVENMPEHVVLVFDEVYYQFADAPDFVRPLPYVKAGKNVVGINSFSKAYGLAGLRVGYSYTTLEIASYIQNLRRPFMINRLSFEGAIAALEDTEFIQETVRQIHEERAFFYRHLDEMEIKYWKTQGNFLMIKPPIKPKLFAGKMLKEGVRILPVAMFGAPECVRVTIGTREANSAFITGLRKILKI